MILLRNGRFSILNDSVQRLNFALQNHQISDPINQLKEKVDHNENMCTDYENKIIASQRGIEITKQEIKILEQLLGTFPDKKAYCDFYKQKKDDNDDDRQNFSIASFYSSNN